MNEPEYIGFVRFGAGSGCPCIEPGERLLTVRKHHHRIETLRGSGVAPGPKENYLLMVSDDGPLWAAHPEVGYDPIVIRREIDRHTGLVSGPETPFRDPYYDPQTQTATLTTWRHALYPAWGGGTIRLTGEYSLADLRSDLASIAADPLVGIGVVPWGAQAAAGVAEIGRGGIWLNGDGTTAQGAFDEAWLGRGTPTGARRQIVTERNAQVWTRGQAIAELRSTLEWGVFLARQGAQIRFRGYFSTEEFWRRDLAGAGAGEEQTAPREYWIIARGILEIWAPEVADADAEATDYRSVRGLRIRFGDRAPSEAVATREWVGVAGSGQGC